MAQEAYVAGDVLHVTRFTARRAGQECDAWAVAESSRKITFIIGYDTIGSDTEPSDWYIGLSDEEWTVVPPEEWPDEVCRAVALYRMGVEP